MCQSAIEDPVNQVKTMLFPFHYFHLTFKDPSSSSKELRKHKMKIKIFYMFHGVCNSGKIDALVITSALQHCKNIKYEPEIRACLPLPSDFCFPLPPSCFRPQSGLLDPLHCPQTEYLRPPTEVFIRRHLVKDI